MFHDMNKKPNPKSVTVRGSTKALVNHRVYEIITQYTNGSWSPWEAGNDTKAERITIKKSIEQFIRERSVAWSVATRRDWINIYRKFADQIGPEIPMDVIRENNISHLLQRDLSYYTAEAYKGRINAWLKWAYSESHTPILIQVNNPIRKHQKQISYITWSELQKIKHQVARQARADARNKHRYPSATRAWMIRFLDFVFIFGLRRQEAVNLRVRDIDMHYRTLKVINTKGKRDEYIPYGKAGYAVKLINRQLSTLKKKGMDNPDNRLFLHADGSRISKAFKAYARAALPAHRAENIKFHSIRHGTATYLLQYMSLNEVKEWMRHEDIRTTLKYAQVMRKNLEKNVGNAFNKLKNEK